MSRSITFRNTVKKYGDFTVIPDLSLEIEKGEFFTLLGPSGCGKTTLLRMAAGFISVDGGHIYFDDTVVNDLHPRFRNIGMVFQDYALFPNLTVAENVAFGLRNRGVGRAEIVRRVDDMLATVQMTAHRDKLPAKLSGGQQQRVALARAMVFHPDVLLMDEPLSNLDAKLRVEMRNVIRELQREAGITTIYVTHDQEEAMAVSDRIAVMNFGVIQQIGTPREIYQRSSNAFVAGFIGQTNFLEGVVVRDQGSTFLQFGGGYRENIGGLGIQSVDEESMKVTVSVRPEEFTVQRDGSGLPAVIRDSMFLGLTTHYVAELETGEQVRLIMESATTDPLAPGVEVGLGLRLDRINLYDDETEENVWTRLAMAG